jgi:phenylalanyl-tRNA synthetase beta chain
MRTTTVPSILQAVSTNFAKKNKDVNLFEIARVYNDESGNIEKGEVPNEPQMITIAEYGEGKDFYTLKGDVEKILDASNVKRYMVQKDENNKSMHPRKNCKNMYWKRRNSSIRRSSSCSKSKLWSKRKGLSCIYLFR